mgnify:CR=1 FL=1
MKKKVIVALTAFAIVFTTLFSFTACSKDKVNIKKGMKPEKVFEMLANAKITSVTTESKIGEKVTRQTFTTEGYTVTRTGGDDAVFNAEIYDGKRKYSITKNAEEDSIEIVDMMGVKNDNPRIYEVLNTGLFGALSGYIYNERNGYENIFTVNFEKDKIIFAYKTQDYTYTIYGINNTTLEIPDKYKDYATRPTTKYLANFEDVEGGLAFTGLNEWIDDEFVIPEKFDGKDVVAIKLVEYFYKCKKITIPVSIKKIEGFSYFFGNVDEMYYAGTKEQWNAVDLTKGELYSDKTVHCTDGDVVITWN